MRSDQEPGNNKEYINADVAAGQALRPQVVENHQADSKRSSAPGYPSLTRSVAPRRSSLKTGRPDSDLPVSRYCHDSLRRNQRTVNGGEFPRPRAGLSRKAQRFQATSWYAHFSSARPTAGRHRHYHGRQRQQSRSSYLNLARRPDRVRFLRTAQTSPHFSCRSINVLEASFVLVVCICLPSWQPACFSIPGAIVAWASRSRDGLCWAWPRPLPFRSWPFLPCSRQSPISSGHCLPVAAVTILIAAVAFCGWPPRFSRTAGRTGRSTGGRRPGRTSSRCPAAAFLISRRLVAAFGRPESFSQTFDNVFHLNAVRYIQETGSRSSYTVSSMTGGGFYPSAWHDLVALLANLTGASIPVAVTSPTSSRLNGVAAGLHFLAQRPRETVSS